MNDFTFKLLGLLVLAPVLVFSLMVHELAHGLVAHRLGDSTAKRMGRLTLNPLKHLDPVGSAVFVITYLIGWLPFGWAKPVPVSPYCFKNRQKGMALVGLAGPVTNFALAVVFALILNAVQTSVDGFLYEILYTAFIVNVVLGVFNLIPVPPLDGSRVVGAFLPRSAYEKWVELDRYGMFLAIIVLMILVYSGLFEWVVTSLRDLFLTNY